MVANPSDLVKVRLQAEGKLPPGVPRRYTGALDAYSKIVRQVTLLILRLLEKNESFKQFDLLFLNFYC